MLTIVAVFGTTISPYLFFWQSSQEAEEIAVTPRPTAAQAGAAQRERQLRRIRASTRLLGMAFSNLIALAIMLAAAATLHQQGITPDRLRRRRRPRRFARSPAISPSPCSRSGSSAPASSRSRCSPARPRSRSPRFSGGRKGSSISRRQAAGFYSIIVAATFMGSSSTGRRSTRSRPCSGARCSTASRGADHGRDDARRLAPQDHGPLHRDAAAADDLRLGGDRGDGRRIRRDAGQHVAS